MRRFFAALFISILLAACGAPTVAPADGTATRHAINLATMGAVGTKQAQNATRPPTSVTPFKTSIEPTATPIALLLPRENGPAPEGARFRLGMGPFNTATISPNSQFLAVGTTTGLFMYRVDPFQRLWERPVDSPVIDILWPIHGDAIAVRLIQSNHVDGYETHTGKHVFSFEHTTNVSSIVWSPDGAQLAVGWGGSSFFEAAEDDLSARLTVWDVLSQQRVYTTEIHNNSQYKASLRRLAWSPDGTMIAGVSDMTFGDDPSQIPTEGTIIWDALSGAQRHILRQQTINYVAFSPNSKWIASWTGDNGSDAPKGSSDILVWDTTTGDLISGLSGESHANTYTVLWLIDGQHLVAGYGDGTVMLWDVQSGDVAAKMQNPDIPIRHLALSPDQQQVAAGGWSGDRQSPITIWNVWQGTVLRTLSDHHTDIRDIAWTGDGQSILTVSDDLLAIRNSAFGDQRSVLSGGPSYYVGWFTVEWSDGGQTLTTWLNDAVTTWDANTGTAIRSIRDEPAAYDTDWKNRAVSPNGQLLAQFTSGTSDSSPDPQMPTVTITDTKSNQILQQLNGPPADTVQVVWSPDGKRIAVGGGLIPQFQGNPPVQGWLENTVVVWDTETWEEIGRFTGHTGRVFNLAFSPDGLYLASSSADGTVIVWQLTP